MATPTPLFFVRPVSRSDSLHYFVTTTYIFVDCYITSISVIAVFSEVFFNSQNQKNRVKG